MPIPANQIIHAEISMKGVMAAGGSGNINTNFVFHYRRTSVAVDPDKTALKTAFAAGPGAAIAALLNVRWSGTLWDIRWLNDATDPYLSLTNALVGAITGDSLSSMESGFLLHRTALRGRSYRGSKHLAPMSESDVTAANEDLFNAGAQTRLAAVNTALITALLDSTGNTWVYGVVSKKNSQLSSNPTTVVFNDVTATLVNKRVGTMRRRQVKSVY